MFLVCTLLTFAHLPAVSPEFSRCCRVALLFGRRITAKIRTLAAARNRDPQIRRLRGAARSAMKTPMSLTLSSQWRPQWRGLWKKG
jgi:hypothetical protein